MEGLKKVDSSRNSSSRDDLDVDIGKFSDWLIKCCVMMSEVCNSTI